MTETRTIHELKPHPLNDEIYHDRADTELVESIAQKGILTPLLITYDDRIISGHRRFSAARELGLAELPVVVFGSTDELDIEEALIEANRQRVKTGEQIGREYKHLKRIYNERESRQGSNQYQQKTASVVITTEAKKPSDKAAEAVGKSKSTASQAEQVVDAIDELIEQGKEDEAEELRTKLKHSVNGAYKKAKRIGAIKGKDKQQDRNPPDFGPMFTVAQWEQLTPSERLKFLAYGGKKQFNQNGFYPFGWDPLAEQISH